MAFCRFEKLSRCFLLLISVGAIFLTLNHHSVQKFSVEMSSHIMKGFLRSNERILYRSYNSTNQSQQEAYSSSTFQEPTVTTAFYTSTSNDTTEDLQIEIRGMYSVISDYISASQQPSYNSTVTLCTQGTYNFLAHVSNLCVRWEGPLSVAVYAPGDDFISAIYTITHMRQCGPPCILLNVTWHLIYDTAHAPSYIPTTLNESIDCRENMTVQSNFKKEKNLLYPINVARNVARVNAKTRYVFPSDVELYPSTGIISRFLKMVQTENDSVNPHVYAVPVFEVKSDSEPPTTKSQLVKLMKEGEAIFFHKYICDACQRFPRREEWLKVLPPNDSMSVFHMTKRNKKLSSWEPIYICTNDVPLYDERLSWEGKKDKMSQMYELCLLNYDVYIIDNAFLVHSPGIKSGKSVIQDHKRRSVQVAKNNKIFQGILKEFSKKYPKKHDC